MHKKHAWSFQAAETRIFDENKVFIWGTINNVHNIQEVMKILHVKFTFISGFICRTKDYKNIRRNPIE